MVKENELMLAVKDGDAQRIRKLLHKHRKSTKKPVGKKSVINVPDAEGFTPLHHAALLGNVDILMAVIEMGGDPNVRDKSGMTCLHMAAWAGKDDSVRLLLENRALPNLASFNGNTPLHLAAQHGYAACVKILLASHADGTFRNSVSETPLDLACQYGHTMAVKQLISDSIVSSLITSLPPGSKSPIHLSAKSGHDDIVGLLLQSGAHVDEMQPEGTPLHVAALYGKTDVARLLLRAGADVFKTNSNGMIPLDLVNKFTTSRAGLQIKRMLREAAGEKVVYGTAVSDYSNQYDTSCLSFKCGDNIAVLDQNTNGRWKGYVVSTEEERIGYFPAMAVQLLATKLDGSVCSMTSTKSSGSGHTNRSVVGSPIQQLPLGVIPLSSIEVVTLVPSSDGRASTVKQTAGGYLPPSHMSSFKNKPQKPPTSPKRCAPSPPSVGPVNGHHDEDILHRLTSIDKHHLNYASIEIPPGTSPKERICETPTDYATVSFADDDVTSNDKTLKPILRSRNSHEQPTTNSVKFSRHLTHESSDNADEPQPLNYTELVTQADDSTDFSHHDDVARLNRANTMPSDNRHVFMERLSRSLSCATKNGTVNHQEERTSWSGHQFEPTNQAAQLVLEWLTELKLPCYFDAFIANGFDMVSIRAITPEDLNFLGISKTGHRKKLLSEIARLPTVNLLPEQKPTSVWDWLEQMDLLEYESNFMEGGFDDIDFIKDLDKNDLDMIDIKKKGHQKKLLLAVRMLHDLELTSILDKVVADTPSVKRAFSFNLENPLLRCYPASQQSNMNTSCPLSPRDDLPPPSGQEHSEQRHPPPVAAKKHAVQKPTVNGAPPPATKPKPKKAEPGLIQGDQGEQVTSAKSRDLFKQLEQRQNLNENMSQPSTINRSRSTSSHSSSSSDPTCRSPPPTPPKTSKKPPPPAPPKRDGSVLTKSQPFEHTAPTPLPPSPPSKTTVTSPRMPSFTPAPPPVKQPSLPPEDLPPPPKELPPFENLTVTELQHSETEENQKKDGFEETDTILADLMDDIDQFTAELDSMF